MKAIPSKLFVFLPQSDGPFHLRASSALKWRAARHELGSFQENNRQCDACIIKSEPSKQYRLLFKFSLHNEMC